MSEKISTSPTNKKFTFQNQFSDLNKAVVTVHYSEFITYGIQRLVEKVSESYIDFRYQYFESNS